MATLLAFDKVNKLGDVGKRRSLPYEQYYGEMDLTEAQIRRRIALAEDIEDAVLFLFTIYLIAKEYDREVDRIAAAEEYEEQLREALRKAQIDEDVIDQYIEDVAREEASVTAKRYLEDDYWTSDDRAKMIAENDSNTCYNGQEFVDAVKSGKTEKQWKSMKDERVRPTHVAVDDETIPIDEYFVVGNSLMRYPRDLSCTDFSEVANCRCSVQYF
jgi:hypothetical protein